MLGPKVITALNAVVGTTTSSPIFVGNYKKVALLFRAASITSGNGVFTVKGGFSESASATPTMTAYNMLIDNVTNTNAQTLTRVASKTLSSNVDVFVWITPDAPLTHIGVTLTFTTDGAYTALIIGWEDTNS